MSAYLPVLILLGVGLTLGTLIMVLSSILGPKIRNKIKMTVYECGVPPIGDAKRRFSVKFYLVAILFLMFPVEAIFFYPLAITYKKFISINGFILAELFFFVAILLVGFIFIWKKGALEWD